VSRISQHNIEDTALMNDLELHEKKPPINKLPVSHLKKPSSSRYLKNSSDGTSNLIQASPSVQQISGGNSENSASYLIAL
jgi:hypothetical protein